MGGHPALVLNADFQPLSYFPLSQLPWDRAIKAVVEATHYVVEEYDTIVRSPSTTHDGFDFPAAAPFLTSSSEVERRVEGARVGGSIPSLCTISGP